MGRWLDGEPKPVVENGQVLPDRVILTDAKAVRNAVGELLKESVELNAAPLPASLFLGNGKAEVSAASLLGLGPLLMDDQDDEASG